MRIRARRREERKEQIMLFLEIETEKERTFSATINRIAKALDMSPSAHLRAIADEMVESGHILSFDAPGRGAVKHIRRYMLIPSKRRKPPGRTIALKVNGQAVEPLKMFEDWS